MSRRSSWTAVSLVGLCGVAALATAQPGVVAKRRAQSLEERADTIADPAQRAQLREAAVAARVSAAEADLAILQAQAAVIDRRLATQRALLAAREAPVARLLATLTALARRPAIATLAQPGSVADIVHAQAVSTAILPVLRARSAALRRAVAHGRVMQASAATAQRRLRAARARLVEAREQLAAVTGGDDDRALAMEEAVRDTAERLTTLGSEQAVLADLMALPLPPVPHEVPAAKGSAYRLPVTGRLVTGMGEVSGNGVRARGLTLAVPAAAAIVSPAGGRVRFAGPFRSFGRIVIVDHGAGWTSLIAGLGTVAVEAGASVAAGAPLGAAPKVDGARVTVELRRRGRPVDIAQLVG
ncbi:murein hydrolase activator EnvC family protein [Sphingomonas phyllosphaerae]|uniref:murein hydrolase activator EnvC family protein n=1 Tax=Sphingomonas phyllosphaerae TaxID=257003 RepID=UPI0004087FD0|nr:peptidoglycan DD-metalloendopeptidase family protein [Sphingomonas phyllosphaerae]